MIEDSVFCPNCGANHKASGRYCEHCGTDLEEVILKYKNKQLPVRYQATAQSGPTAQQPQYQQRRSDEYYDDRPHRSDRGFWDALFGILFFWMCCGPDCR